MYVVGCIAAAGERSEEKNQIGYDKYAAMGGKGKPQAPKVLQESNPCMQLPNRIPACN